MISRKRVYLALAVAGCALVTVAARAASGPDSTTPRPAEAAPAPVISSVPAVEAVPHPSPIRTATPAPTTRAPERAASVPDAKSLTTSLTKLFGGGNAFSVAGLDLSTGQSIQAGATSGMTEASVVKLDILGTALYQGQQGGYYNEADAEQMMEQSDNIAADQVFQGVGGNAALDAYNARLGLTSTTLDPSGVWGLSVTSASDQLKLMQALVSTTSPLTAASRQHALELMGDVEADQDWGVSAAADAGASTQLKNGWLDVDSDGGLWAVNSVGLTTCGSDRMLLVVLSQHNPDYQTGIDRVQAGAKLLAATLSR